MPRQGPKPNLHEVGTQDDKKGNQDCVEAVTRLTITRSSAANRVIPIKVSAPTYSPRGQDSPLPSQLEAGDSRSMGPRSSRRLSPGVQDYPLSVSSAYYLCSERKSGSDRPRDPDHGGQRGCVQGSQRRCPQRVLLGPVSNPKEGGAVQTRDKTASLEQVPIIITTSKWKGFRL